MGSPKPTNNPRRAAAGLLAWVESPESRDLLPIARQALRTWLRWLVQTLPEESGS